MSDFLSVPPISVAGRDRICADDVLFLRKHLFPRGLTSAEDATALITIHRSCAERCAEWDSWFVEALTAFAVFHSWPQRTLDDINADWLIALISNDGMIATTTEMQLLLHVIDVSHHVPQQLTALAIDQLRIAIEHGEGPLADDRKSKRHGLGGDDISFLYRILKGSAHSGKMLLGRLEIAALRSLDQVVENGRNHPAWRELMKAISPRRDWRDPSPRPWLRMLEVGPQLLDDAVA